MFFFLLLLIFQFKRKPSTRSMKKGERNIKHNFTTIYMTLLFVYEKIGISMASVGPYLTIAIKFDFIQ